MYGNSGRALTELEDTSKYEAIFIRHTHKKYPESHC